MNDTEKVLVGNRYRLDQPIGHGRAGTVWLAFDTMWHRTVATKKLYLDAEKEPEHARTAALDNGRQAMRVVHTNAIKVYDTLRDGDDIWLVMGYVPSRSMADFLTEHGRLTPEHTAYLGIALGSALLTAHTAGVLHRAVEPGNVLLADDGGVKLTDIGISDAPPDPAFQAPEVLGGAPATEASDAYSLGAILFLAVEGKPPFGPDGTGEPAVPHYAGPLTGALLKLLRSDPALRPTIADTVDALKAVNQGQQNGHVPPTAPAIPAMPLSSPPARAAAGPVSRPMRIRSFTRRWGLVLLVVLAVVAMLVLLVQ